MELPYTTKYQSESCQNKQLTENGFFQANQTGRYQYKFISSIPFAQQTQMNQRLHPIRIDRPAYLAQKKDSWGKPPSREIPHVKHINFQPLDKHDGTNEILKSYKNSRGGTQTPLQGKKTYIRANKRSETIVEIEQFMGQKIRVNNLYQKRNEQQKVEIFSNRIPLRSHGDKIYKFPTYDSQFFLKDDSLVPGFNIQERHRYPFKISKKFH